MIAKHLAERVNAIHDAALIAEHGSKWVRARVKSGRMQARHAARMVLGELYNRLAGKYRHGKYSRMNGLKTTIILTQGANRP